MVDQIAEEGPVGFRGFLHGLALVERMDQELRGTVHGRRHREHGAVAGHLRPLDEIERAGDVVRHVDLEGDAAEDLAVVVLERPYMQRIPPLVAIDDVGRRLLRVHGGRDEVIGGYRLAGQRRAIGATQQGRGTDPPVVVAHHEFGLGAGVAAHALQDGGIAVEHVLARPHRHHFAGYAGFRERAVRRRELAQHALKHQQLALDPSPRGLERGHEAGIDRSERVHHFALDRLLARLQALPGHDDGGHQRDDGADGKRQHQYLFGQRALTQAERHSHSLPQTVVAGSCRSFRAHTFPSRGGRFRVYGSGGRELSVFCWSMTSRRIRDIPVGSMDTGSDIEQPPPSL